MSNRQMTLDVAAVVAREVAVTLRSGLWPFARLRPLPRPDPRSERLPVVMVHGFMGHPEMFRPLARSLLAAGWGRIERVHYPSTQLNLEEIVDRIDQVVRPLVQDGGQVDLVGHSLGAVASRAYLKVFGGAQYVRRFVSLGGPHHGTAWHPLLPPRLQRVFDPDGPWVKRLGQDPEPVPTTVIRARYDHQVMPPFRAALPEIHEIVLERCGHNGLLWSTSAHRAIIEFLGA